MFKALRFDHTGSLDALKLVHLLRGDLSVRGSG